MARSTKKGGGIRARAAESVDPAPVAGREWEAAPEPGWVAAGLEEELDGLSVRTTLVERGSGRTPPGIKELLRELSSRFYGAHAIQMRQRPIPHAYRVFFRHIGLDPDTTRTPIEELALRRVQEGRFKSRNLLDDALTIATVESGVALRALDADRVTGRIGIRLSAPGEPFEGRASALPPGTLVLADEERAVGILFGETAEGRGVGRATRRTLLVAIGVRGIPEVSVEEALWLAASTMRGA